MIYYRITLFILTFSLTGIKGMAQSNSSYKGFTMVYLVRHAEKMDNSRDPMLSEKGNLRAGQLAKVLSDSGIEFVHSSDFIRTRETARPLCEKLGIEFELYDPKNPEELKEWMLEQKGKHLVVGHSNSTPRMVSLLGADPGPPIDEKSEFDRLYIVIIDAKGNVSSSLLRYGESSELSKD